MAFIKQYWQTIILVAIAALSVVAVYYISGQSFGICPVETPSDIQLKTVATLTEIVDLGLKLSTALVGFGAAALIGLKAEVKLSGFMRLMVVVSVVLFAQSALYGVWWRFGIAQMYLNECLVMVTSPAIQWRFQAHVQLFMMGIFAVGLLVLGALYRKPEKEEYDT